MLLSNHCDATTMGVDTQKASLVVVNAKYDVVVVTTNGDDDGGVECFKH